MKRSASRDSLFLPAKNFVEATLYKGCFCARRWRQSQKASLRRVSESLSRTLKAVTEIDAFFSLQDGPHDKSLTKPQLFELMSATGCPANEASAIEELFDQIDRNKNGYLSYQEWLAFRDVELQNHADNENCFCVLLRKVDLFKAVAWHEWEKLQSGSVVGGILSFLAIGCLVATIATSVSAFWKDRNTIVTQKNSQNSYPESQIPEFFIYFRTSSWQNIMDPSVFSFHMSYYIKTINASGQVVEHYVTVPVSTSGPAEINWWPISVPRDTLAAIPSEPVRIAGAYHKRFFKQLEVKLTPCQNKTGAPVCRTADEIRNVLHGGSVNLVIRSPGVDYTSVQIQYWIVKVGETKQVDLWFQQKEVEIAGKYPLASKTSLHLLPYTHSTEQLALPWTSDGGTLIVWWFTQEVDKVFETHQRENVSALFGLWGGTWATLAASVGLLAIWYNRQHLKIMIASHRIKKYQLAEVRMVAVSNARAAWFDRVPEKVRRAHTTNCVLDAPVGCCSSPGHQREMTLCKCGLNSIVPCPKTQLPHEVPVDLA